MQISVRMVAAVAGTLALVLTAGRFLEHGPGITAWLDGSPAEAATNGLADGAVEATDAAALDLLAVAQAEALRAAAPKLPDLPAFAPLDLSRSVALSSRIDDVTADYVAPMTMAITEYDQLGQPCAKPAMTLTLMKPALLGLAVTAPCHAGEVVNIRHGALVISERLDEQGTLALTLPAMATQGTVTVDLDRGYHLDATRLVPDIGSVSRFALVMRGQTGLTLNAYPGDAGFGSDGHIRPSNPGQPTLGQNGFLTELGDPTLERPMTAAIITVPAARPGARLEIVANVEEANCNRDIFATTLSAEGSVVPDAGAITFAMPGCEAIGQRLVMDGAIARRIALAAASQ